MNARFASIRNSVIGSKPSTDINIQKSQDLSKDNGLVHTYLEVPELRGAEDDSSRIPSKIVVTPYNRRLPLWRRANEQDPAQEKWSNRFEFVHSCLGYTIGFTPVFLIPMNAVKWGGIYFLITFTLLSLFLGIPLLFFEVAIGQFSGLGPAQVFALMPVIKGLGYTILLQVTVADILYSSYNAVHAFRLFDSFRSTEPWRGVDPNISLHLKDIVEYHVQKIQNKDKSINGLGSLNWPIVGCLAFVLLIIYIVTSRSIKSIGKIVRHVVPITFILCLILFLFVFARPGVNRGLKYFMNPENNKFTFQTLYAALRLMVLSYGFGHGINILNGSYTRFQSPAHIDCLIVSLVTLCISLLSCLFLFAGLELAAEHLNLDLPVLHSYITNRKYYLSTISVIYPLIFDQLPIPMLGYFMFNLVAFSLSTTSMFVVASMISRSLYAFNPIIRLHQKLTNLAIVVLLFLLALPLLTQNNHHLLKALKSLRWVQMTTIIIELLAFVFCYGLKKLRADINFMLHYNPSIFYCIAWILTPFIVAGISIYQLLTDERAATTTLWVSIPRDTIPVIVLSPILLFAVIAIVRFCRRRNWRGAFIRRSEEEVLERELPDSNWEYLSKGTPSNPHVPSDLPTMNVEAASTSAARKASGSGAAGRKVSASSAVDRKASASGADDRRMSASGAGRRKASASGADDRRMSSSSAGRRKASARGSIKRMSTIARRESFSSIDSVREVSALESTYDREQEPPHATNPARMNRRAKYNIFYEPNI